jgi:aconitate hydratase
MSSTHVDSFSCVDRLRVGDREYTYYRLDAVERAGIAKVATLPYSIRILLENLLRFEDGRSVTRDDIHALASWSPTAPGEREIAYRPARVLLQDFTGVPAVVDLAAMRDAIIKMGGKADQINPLQPVELVIDHSVQVDFAGSNDAFARNAELEFERNGERYAFLKWGQRALRGFRAVPPDTGIVHQVNIEYLARVIFGVEHEGAAPDAYPDSVVGTDSHTTMADGLGVLAWGVGGIEAEAAMLGQPITMLIPQVVGVRVNGKLREGVTATDLVLTVTEMLRKRGVVGKFVEFFGPGLDALTVADRVTIGNMSPEYGSTVAFFPVDQQTLAYLRLTGRSEEQIQLVEAYSRAQGLFRDASSPDPSYNDTLDLDLDTIVPSLAGPRRPQDRIALDQVKSSFKVALAEYSDARAKRNDNEDVALRGDAKGLGDGAVVIAAITSCTNTSNPSVLIAAGLLAKRAVELGLVSKPWVKTSLAPGSTVVTAYLKKSGLLPYLEKLGFNVVGYGCTTCIGNSGPLTPQIADKVAAEDYIVAAVLSGNRNFEGRIHPQVRANYLASPPLVVAYALTGRMDIDITTEPIGTDTTGKAVYLRDLWPSNADIDAMIAKSVSESLFRENYSDVFTGDARWQAIDVALGDRYTWDPKSEYVKHPPYFEGMAAQPTRISDIESAAVLALLGDSVTTDHISPAGSIAKNSAAAKYLIAHGIEPKDFNSYGARRGNHEVMVRGTFANVRLRNALVPGVEGSFTTYMPTDPTKPAAGEQMSIFDASEKYRADKTPLIVIAGKEYGSGSSRDWAAKGPMLLGVRAVIAESYERIHRSNLIGMGILPLEFVHGESAQKLELTGDERYTITGLAGGVKPRMMASVVVEARDGVTRTFDALVRIDTPDEAEYYRHGGILHYVLRNLLAQSTAVKV